MGVLVFVLVGARGVLVLIEVGTPVLVARTVIAGLDVGIEGVKVDTNVGIEVGMEVEVRVGVRVEVLEGEGTGVPPDTPLL